MDDDKVNQLQKKIFDLERLVDSAQKQQARDVAILRGIGNGLIVTGQLGKVTLINQAACQMLGYESEDVIGRDLNEVLPMEVLETGKGSQLVEERSVLSALATGKKETTYYLIRRDGSKFPAELTTSSIIFDDQVIGAAIVFNDITLQKQAEQAKSDFIAIASHQLRTPLGVMKWNVEMLLNGDYGELPEAAKKATGDILSSDMRLINLINNLLDISRIDQGRVSNQPESTDLAGLVAKIVEELKVTAINKGVELTMDNHCVAPPVFIDPRRFREVVENLIDNAIKYTPSGGKVKVEMDGDNKEVQFSVTDTGMGIPDADQPRMFDRFFRAGNAIKSETEGSGLGLYVVRSYVEAWDGKIWFKSKENEGSTFYFKIPVVVK